MGADLLLTWTEYPTYRNGDRVSDWSKLPALCAPRIERLTAESIADPSYWRELAFASRDVDDVVDLPTVASVDDPLTEPELALVKRILTEDVEVLSAPPRGELAPVTIGGTTYLFSGGPSWGDSPTECFDPIEHIDQADLFRIPFPGPEED